MLSFVAALSLKLTFLLLVLLIKLDMAPFSISLSRYLRMDIIILYLSVTEGTATLKTEWTPVMVTVTTVMDCF